MDHHHHDEKLLAFPPGKNSTQVCYYLCHSKCPVICLPPLPPILQFSPPLSLPLPLSPPPPPPPPPRPPPPLTYHSNQFISPLVIIIVAVILASAFLLLIYYSVVKYFSNRSISRRSATPPTNSHEENDQTQNPMEFTWHVRTVGLSESVINSISVCKYKRGEGLIEGTVCSVCLNEFREDEDLRLLPKCNHAFHLPCIDMWLNSHVNCPLCRAIVVVSNPVSSPSTDPSAMDESQMGNLQNHIELGSSHSNEIFGNDIFAHENASELEDLSIPRANSGFRALSDLIDRGFANGMMDGETQRVRRSVSMDSLSSAISSISLPNLPSIDFEGSSTASGVLSTGSKKFNFGEASALNRIFPKHGWNQDKSKMLSNDSRSSSGSWRFLLTRYGRSKNSVLPL